ncbi:AraC family transcriptional regulator [Aureibaculum sp. 2210JD6-5]|uniref:AraC family transcriptional regulator n=1 Tax=Aureibaculum sp. 2210JD6-5 TaxID=3103957 RepID=UPI002AAD340E|nr:AraC family transcriptional regulator [Aureibaculum sp. 2210JD6-5]MDY7394817.1 AraC family transcriptional regulator [Aureibaculum sp. 2210JD6-5]
MKTSFKIILTLFTFSVFNVSIGHTQDIKDYSKKFDALGDSVAKYRKNNSRLAVEFAKKQLILAEKFNDTVKTIITLHEIGRNLQFIAEFKESIEYFEKELSLLKSVDIKNNTLINDVSKYTEIEVLAQLGQNYVALGQFKKAFKIYDKCLEIAQKENLGFYKAVMPTIIADLYYTIGNYKEALTRQKESFNALNYVDDITENTRVYNRGAIIISMSNTYLKLNEKDSALWVLDKGEKEKLDTLDLAIKTSFKTQRGQVYLEKKEFDKALVHLKEAENIAYRNDSILAPAIVGFTLAETYYNLKKYDSAIAILEKGIAIKKQKTKEIYLTEDYKLLAKIYKEAGNLEKSNENYEKYILNQTALEKSKDTISLSFHTQELSNLEEEKSSQKKRFYLFMGVGLALLIILLGYIIYLIKEKKKNTEKFNALLSKFNQEQTTTLEIIDTKDNVLEEKISAEVNEETTEQILSGLQTLKEQEYFLRQDCNSYNVAKKIKTNTSYLSKVINSHFEKNFNTYINDLRINYALLRLKNDNRFRSFSVQSIAEELGYKSADSFTKYFKLRTGLNPSFYIKQLNSLS